MKLVNAEEVRQIFDYEVAQGATDLFDAFDSAIENATEVDAAPVVHGRWVQCKDWDYDYECSVCEGYAGEDIDGNYNKLTPYYPNCGAKMDGDKNA